jgi:branched-chain amino acid transport system permease protein
MVTFAPAGFTGIILEHAPIARAGLLRRLAWPYARLVLPGLIVLIGFVGLVELLSFLTIGMAQGKHFVLFGRELNVLTAMPWLVALLCLVGGGAWLAREARSFRHVWAELMDTARARGER